MSIATSTIATLPEIQFASNGWQTTKFSSDRTVVEINWRTASIEVVRMTMDELTAMPARVCNGHASWFCTAPGTRKADIVEMVTYYAGQIIDIMSTYDANRSIDRLAYFGDNDELQRYICQGLEWALAGE